MIEVNETYDLLPDMNQEAYLAYGRKALATMLKAPGRVESHVYRSLLGSPRVRLSLVRQTLVDWAMFAASPQRQMLDSELFQFAADIGLEVIDEPL